MKTQRFDTANALAKRRKLSYDAIHAAEFASTAVSARSIELHLVYSFVFVFLSELTILCGHHINEILQKGAIEDLDFVLGEAVSRVAETAATHRILIQAFMIDQL